MQSSFYTLSKFNDLSAQKKADTLEVPPFYFAYYCDTATTQQPNPLIDLIAVPDAAQKTRIPASHNTSYH